MMMPQPGPVFAVSGRERLMQMKGIFLKQKMHAAEILLPIEIANSYSFFPIDQNGMKFPVEVFKAKEESNALIRQIGGAERPFQMRVRNTNGPMELGDLLFLDRPWACCQCNKGEMRVTCVEGKQQYLGRIFGPCTCCNFNIQILDAQESLKYSLVGDGCQCGTVCACCPCESCRIVNFTLRDASGAVLSQMQRRQSYLASLISDADDFELTFPASANAEDRMLLLAAMIFMDYCYFEESPNQNQNKSAVSIRF
jgi:hypothetical protein